MEFLLYNREKNVQYGKSMLILLYNQCLITKMAICMEILPHISLIRMFWT
jgi:hypothetical protein